MGAIVGSAESVSTWGKFRCAISYKTPSDFEPNGNSVVYLNGLKSASPGNGLMRSGPQFFYFSIEFFNIAFTTGSFPPFALGNRMIANPATGILPIETQDQLTGETVTFQDLRTGVIPPSFWTTGSYTWSPAIIGNTFAGDEIVGITKLERF